MFLGTLMCVNNDFAHIYKKRLFTFITIISVFLYDKHVFCSSDVSSINIYDAGSSAFIYHGAWGLHQPYYT